MTYLKYFQNFEQIIKDHDHYLLKSKIESHHYHEEFKQTIRYIAPFISNKKLKILLSSKLQINKSKFKEKQFVQCACETTITSFFAKNFPNSFIYEEQVNESKNTDIDCSFQENGYKFHIEVKCANYDSKERIKSQNALKIGSMGRIPDWDNHFELLSKIVEENTGMKEYSEYPDGVVKSKNMDNNLKDFLTSSNEKFPQKISENELNVLFVCCGDEHDIQEWHANLFSTSGLFTNHSYVNQSNYRNVDAVVFNNLYHRHFKFFEKNNLLKIWNLDNSFNFVCINPFRLANKFDAIQMFLNLIPNYNDELKNFRVKGDIPEEVKNLLRISHFVNEEIKVNDPTIF